MMSKEIKKYYFKVKNIKKKTTYNILPISFRKTEVYFCTSKVVFGALAIIHFLCKRAYAG
jgi:hypothetical protein